MHVVHRDVDKNCGSRAGSIAPCPLLDSWSPVPSWTICIGPLSCSLLGAAHRCRWPVSGSSPAGRSSLELREELGIGVLLGAEIPSAAGQEWPILHGHTMRIWFVQIVDGAPEPLADHDELRWLPATDLYQVPWLEPDLPIVDAVSALLERAG